MTKPKASDIWETLETTWPAAETSRAGGFLLRNGADGGKRVSAATRLSPLDATDIESAENAMAALGQAGLFMIRGQDLPLDAVLSSRGYEVVDPVTIYASDPTSMSARIPPVSVFEVWEPLAIQREIWAAGGVGTSRLKVMERAAGPKTSLFGRASNRPAGSVFVAMNRQFAMVHALEVLSGFRRRGLGKLMMQGAANWACKNNAKTLLLAVTEANMAANRLYSSMGMTVVERYHYRIKA